MGNSYFRFKQFNIQQDKCAMKVSTDACIQGAWTPLLSSVERVLDIGAGTGLLSLMLAQRKMDVQIDTVELDKDAVIQAGDNIAATSWNNRISLIQADATEYNYAHKYDLIISNPPFFKDSLLGPTAQRNAARHTLSLSYRQLFSVISNNLSGTGYASVLLPADSYGEWKQIIEENNWFVSGRLLVYPKPEKAANRVVALCSPTGKAFTADEELTIRNSDNSYTKEYAALMHPFYLDK